MTCPHGVESCERCMRRIDRLLTVIELYEADSDRLVDMLNTAFSVIDLTDELVPAVGLDEAQQAKIDDLVRIKLALRKAWDGRLKRAALGEEKT